MNHSGYSQAAQNMIMALDKSGEYDIRLRIFGDKPTKPAISDKNYEYFMKMVRKEDDPERILIYHCIPNIQRRIQKPRRSIGVATFETYQPPEAWAVILNNNDAVMTPSHFNHKIFKHMDIKKPIYYIPHCIDTEVYNRKVKALRKYDRFTFLFMGIWRERKGYQQLIEAWFDEFTDGDNVQLIIKTDRPRLAEQYIRRYRKEKRIDKGFAPIIVEDKVFDEEQLPRFIKSADCLISPTMGEGFGYPGLQCMALHVPVIISDFSGCQDYANAQTATLIDVSSFVLKQDMDGIPQFRGRKWAFIEVKKIRKAMRHVLKYPDSTRMKATIAYSYVRQHFSYKKVTELFSDMIRELYG